jgi:predicted nucleotidyltransferase
MELKALLASRQIKTFCQSHHIRRLSFFGSVVRDDLGPQSDIDVLCYLKPSPRMSRRDPEIALREILSHAREAVDI